MDPPRTRKTVADAPARDPRASRIDRLRIRHLRLLECIADGGSLSTAARRLEVSQPGATRMLHELEAAFGCSLIERTPRGATMSAAGAAALGRLRLALGALDAAAAGLAAPPGPPLVRLGLLPLVALTALPAIAAALDRDGALPRMAIREATVDGLMQGLRDGELDAVVSSLDADAPALAGLQTVRLWEDGLAIAAAPAHPLARQRRLTAELLRQARWVLPPSGASVRRHFDRWFLEAGTAPPSPHVESPSFHTNLSLAAAGPALTVGPRSAVRHYAARGLVRELRPERPLPNGPLFFVTRQELAGLPEIGRVEQALQAFARAQQEAA